MSQATSNITEKLDHDKFNYRHPIPRRLGLQNILQSKKLESPQRGPRDAPVVPTTGHKRCKGDFDQDVLEPGVIGSQSKLKPSMRRPLQSCKKTKKGQQWKNAPLLSSGRRRSPPNLPADCDTRRLQNNRTEGGTIRTRNDTHCNGIKCQVSCERTAKRRGAIDNSCLPTDSYTNAELQSYLRAQDLYKDTPLLTAVRYHHFGELNKYLRRLKASDTEAGTNSLKEILTIQNEAYDTCLTLAAKLFYPCGNLQTSSLASSVVQVLLDYCSSFPEILMISTGNSLTAIHHLLDHVPTALEKGDSLFFTVAESMVKMCPDMLTVRSRKDERYNFEENPFEKLNRIMAEVVLMDDSVGAVALTGFSDYLKYLCIKQGYDLGVLYKVGEEPTMALDLTYYAGRSILYKDLNSFQRPKFDAVLQFISIPRSFEIVERPRPPDIEPRCHDADGRHKQYEWHTETIGTILHWLRDRKTIRTILHVQVEDLGEGCDCILELMENSLWIYRIETWDWRRYNVPISTICNATSQRKEIRGPDEQHSSVRNLNLYWRGEPESFPGDGLKHLKPTAFPKLQWAYKERVDMYLKTCQNSLCQSFQGYQRPVLDWSFMQMPSSNVKPKDTVATIWDDPSDPKDGFLGIMYKWGIFLGSTGLRPTRPVTVAIVDDGFDLTRASIKENFKGTPGASFQPSGLKSYMSGAAVGYKSHGTIMASCVKQMCPQVRILPIRIKTGHQRDNTSRSFSPFDVIQALEFIAKLEHVDIVNMSWTIEFPPDFNPQYASARGDSDETYQLYSKLRKTMNALITKGIILLCATSDKGCNETSRDIPEYPGAFGFHNPDILTIGSASSNGHRLGPAYTPVHFIFPGENVPLGPDLGEASGSSVATAIASGMVANIIFLVDLVNQDRDRLGGQVVPRDKITTSTIAGAFKSLYGSPTHALEVSCFKQNGTQRETCEIDDFETKEGRLSCGGLAIAKRLLRRLKLVTD